ncbi:MFS transporter [Gracilibacillus marinus]|jgi:MFS transporter, YQGE family, putative transporter|uniref:MFS transporter n=1 Tax=Gracilibacillus marinus TaxID=630535 RepID=A0ABV8VZ72_9BACI
MFRQVSDHSSKVKKDLHLLLIIGGLYALATFLSNTFVNIFIWKKSGEYIDIATYNLAIYILQPISFYFAGKCAKKVDRVLILRLGILILSLFYIFVLILGDYVTTIPYVAGALLGVGYGFYWLSFNVLTFEITEPDTRDYFNGILGALQSFGGMVGPLFAGYIISILDNFTGYTYIFLVSFILFILAVIISFYLQRRKATGRFSIRFVQNERRKNKSWRTILHSHIAQGMREGLFIFIIAIWVYVESNSEFALGIFNLLFSFSSFISYFFISKLIKQSNRKIMIFIGGLLLYLAVAIFVFHTNYITLLVYGVIVGLSYPIFNVPFVSLTYDVIGTSRRAREYRIEYIVMRELFINMGRIVAIVCFIIGTVLFQESIIAILILFFGAGNLAAGVIIKRGME